MEVVDCENSGTVCGADLAETCLEYIQDGEKSTQYVKEPIVYEHHVT